MTASVLDSQLCVAVYKAAHAFNAAYRPLLEPHGLTYPQYVVLLALWDSGSNTVKDLGALVDLDSGTLSPLLTRLEAAGHIVKSRSNSDARVVEIAVTTSGQQLQEQLRDVTQQIGRCTGFDLQQGAALLQQLHSLTQSLRQAAQ